MRPRIDQPDLAIWAAYTAGMRRLDGMVPPTAPPPPDPPPPDPPSPPKPATPRPQPSKRSPTLPTPVVTGIQPAGLDRASWDRLRSGRLTPTRTLDLHGRTTHSAYRALERFLSGAHTEGLRCVEIITGGGTKPTGGAIRRELPFWLNLPHLRPLVLAATHPHPRNPGSTIVLLKRTRTGS